MYVYFHKNINTIFFKNNNNNCCCFTVLLVKIPASAKNSGELPNFSIKLFMFLIKCSLYILPTTNKTIKQKASLFQGEKKTKQTKIILVCMRNRRHPRN